MAKTFYVASRASIPERSAMWRGLRAAGASIVSTWIDEADEDAVCVSELWPRIVAEIKECDAFVLYLEDTDLPLKGALVEVGVALAYGKPVTVVAPNIELDPRNFRPLGSWAAHPLVSFAKDVNEALFG